MSQEYHVFICHRGTETKHNVACVLSGMLSLKGIKCFVDYQMEKGTHVISAINSAIESSKVFIIILSADFAGSKWCLDEIVQIMKVQGDSSMSDRTVIPVFYDVPRSVVYDLSKVKRSTDEEKGIWRETLQRACGFEGFEYDSEKTFQWEKSAEIVEKVQKFLTSRNIIPDKGTKTSSSRKNHMSPHYDVFICHYGPDTQHNVVSLLRGMLLSMDFTCFVVGYQMNDGERECNSDIETAIRNSRVQVVFLSPNFISSKRCLEEVVYIVNMHCSSGTSNTPCKQKVFTYILQCGTL
ncbi:hypothetical protein KP509_05G037900 [Ceratopteris richardii]|uniref:ADP-ribosyl cyclase/cyclic ADP-ribose hydrolase n=1 Tax=Ceratopteris richardii TaxID=49495 RepID=A0A8T2UPZ1_CERRI|nr:hypothetical protein KP509_05G037900 [Ceratopteris richardii]